MDIHYEALEFTGASIHRTVRSWMNRGYYDRENVDLQNVHVPEGENPTPATVYVTVNVGEIVLTALMLFPIIRGEIHDGITHIYAQQRDWDDTLIGEIHPDDDWPALTATVNELLKRRFGSKLESVGGLRRLKRDTEPAPERRLRGVAASAGRRIKARRRR